MWSIYELSSDQVILFIAFLFLIFALIKFDISFFLYESKIESIHIIFIFSFFN